MEGPAAGSLTPPPDLLTPAAESEPPPMILKQQGSKVMVRWLVFFKTSTDDCQNDKRMNKLAREVLDISFCTKTQGMTH